jgi:hypothetical protein
MQGVEPLDVLLMSLAAMCGGVYLLAFRWARRTLGVAEVEPIPAARIRSGRRHRGFGQEPAWVRSLQSAVLAFGITGISMAAVGFCGFLGVALLGS